MDEQEGVVFYFIAFFLLFGIDWGRRNDGIGPIDERFRRLPRFQPLTTTPPRHSTTGTYKSLIPPSSFNHMAVVVYGLG